MSRPDIFRDLLSTWLDQGEATAIRRGLKTKLTPVESSNLAAVGYDPDKGILEIAFLDGSVYQYEDVPQEVYAELMQASSHGSYFYHYIRDDYEFVRLG